MVRSQAGRQGLVVKVPLKVARVNDKSKDDTTDLSDVVVDDSDEDLGDGESSGGSAQDTESKEMDWEAADKGNNIDEFLNKDEDSDDDNAEDDENAGCYRVENAFSGTELGTIVTMTQRIIQLSNTTAKKQVSTNKQKQQWWDNRKKLDAKMKEVVYNIEANILGWRKAILVAPPSDKSIREALANAADMLESDLMQASANGAPDEHEPEPERKSTRSKSASVKAKTKSAPKKKQEKDQPVAIPPIDRPLLEVCLGAVPYLSDSEIGDALESISGRPLDSTWVATVRSAYEKCVSSNGKKRATGTEDVERQTLILALDGKLQRLPWESLPCLDMHSVTRVPSLLYANILFSASSHLLSSGINPKCAFYLLNAEGDLTKTQECFEVQFKRRPGWQGLVGIRPSAEEYKQALSEHDLFVYCGHGSGEQYLKRDAVARLPKCAVALLMGCSSGFLSDEGDFEPTGMANSFLVALSPSVVGNLWDVTDGELDRLTKALLGAWLDQGLPLPQALAVARKTCTFRYLVAAAAVCYGVPISVSN